jgi:hypothetical protein
MNRTAVGLTRPSILKRRSMNAAVNPPRRLDGRVKPGHDGFC